MAAGYSSENHLLGFITHHIFRGFTFDSLVLTLNSFFNPFYNF